MKILTLLLLFFFNISYSKTTPQYEEIFDMDGQCKGKIIDLVVISDESKFFNIGISRGETIIILNMTKECLNSKVYSNDINLYSYGGNNYDNTILSFIEEDGHRSYHYFTRKDMLAENGQYIVFGLDSNQQFRSSLLKNKSLRDIKFSTGGKELIENLQIELNSLDTSGFSSLYKKMLQYKLQSK